MRDQKKLKGLEKTREQWLPHHLQFEVLWRLPSKTLAWARFVSKEWKNIVSDRRFIKLQLKPREQLSGFFFQGSYDGDVKSVSYLTVDRDFTEEVEKGVLNFLPENVVILSSSNGLICCRSSSSNVLYVCNPLNRERITLQWPNLPKDSSTALIFEPFKSQIDVSTDFKVVTVCQRNIEEDEFEDEDEDGIQFSFNIYSSQTKVWTKSEEMCVGDYNLQNKACVFVEGVIFWLINGDQILMFDPERDLSGVFKQPIPEFNFRMCIGEAEDRLQYVIISKKGLRVWKLESWSSDIWSLKHLISLDDLENENPEYMYNISEKLESHLTTDDTFPWINLLSFKDTTLLLSISTDIYAFNFDTRKAKPLCTYSALGPNSMLSPIVIPYTMSLVPLGPL